MSKSGILWLVVIVLFFTSCVKNRSGVSPVQGTMPSGSNVFEVSEVIQGNTYSYLKVKENSAERWVAVSKQEVSPGDVYYYDNALAMSNFHSNEIDRTFDEIFFVSEISETPILQNAVPGAMQMHSGKVPTVEKNTISINKQAGELTIAEIFANRSAYEGKIIEIKGMVVKVNESIMDRNWIHLQDGTSSNGEFDLTVTSHDFVTVDEVVTLKGKISLNRDFGAGYIYDVIVEDAELVNK
jgi:hypothetical protein